MFSYIVSWVYPAYYGQDTAKLFQTFKEQPRYLNLLGYSLTRLPPLPYLPRSLRRLDCANTCLKELPPLPPSLEYLNVSNTHIRELPPLPSTLTNLFTHNTPLICEVKQGETPAQYTNRVKDLKHRVKQVLSEYD